MTADNWREHLLGHDEWPGQLSPNHVVSEDEYLSVPTRRRCAQWCCKDKRSVKNMHQ